MTATQTVFIQCDDGDVITDSFSLANYFYITQDKDLPNYMIFV